RGQPGAVARRGGPDPPARCAGCHRRQRLGRRGPPAEQPAGGADHLLRRIRRGGDVRRRLRDLEHLLHHDRAAVPAACAAAGAGRVQVFRWVLAEAALVGAAGAVAGAVLGLAVSKGLAALLSAFGVALPMTGLSVPPAQVALACAIGLVIALAAALAPAYRAARVAPVQALRDAAPGAPGFSGRRLAAALAVTGTGAALLLAGLLSGAAVAVIATGAGLCFLGVTIAGPLLAGPLAAAAGAPLTRLPARVGALARGNTMRNPRRTSATAAALMVGLAVVTAVAVLVGSARS